MTERPEPEDPQLPERSRWIIVGGLSLLALPVTFSFFFLGLVAFTGCFVDCVERDPRPVYGSALAVVAAVMGGGWAGLVPWAMGRPRLILRTAGAGALVVLATFAVVRLLSSA